ncbi:alginate lyase-domain-containing protein [Endogone sp. FLAS-F59071]|nr:alginate lyase-domain-containing protein [Endogone sp. FLAS-F59071]|eukprot:RUS13408.1 alginate lyase-domain-containing protein [Endogone sp. FLAS-F59071]
MPSRNRNRHALILAILAIAFLLVTIEPVRGQHYDIVDFNDFSSTPDSHEVVDLDIYDTVINPRYDIQVHGSVRVADASTVRVASPRWGPIDGVNADLIDKKILSSLRAAIKAGKVPADKKEAVAALKPRADGILARHHRYSVTFSTVEAPNNSSHYYYSRLSYAWPICPKGEMITNPQLQCPWKIWDGHFYPGDSNITCLLQLTRFSRDIQTLSVAYYLFGEEAYAAQFVHLVKTWFLDKLTYMAPDLSYAQVIPHGYEWTWRGSRTGLIDTHTLITFLSAIDLIKTSPSWDTKTRKGLQNWFKDYIKWFETSTMGIAESKGLNNQGTYYKGQLAAFSLFVGRKDVAKQQVIDYIEQDFTLQFNRSGAQPMELRRVFSSLYSYFNLQGVMYLAKVGQLFGIDLWHMKNRNGVTLQDAVDFLIPLSLSPRATENPANLLPLLEDARNHYPAEAAKYSHYISKIRKLTSGGDLLSEWILWK